MQTHAQSISRALTDHGCTHVFTLMGDGNMHLVLALAEAGVEAVEVRHESAAVAMAEGYGWSSGRVGICSVTHGPGLSHTATSLLVASRNRSPLVLLAGETPTGYKGAQRFDQRRLVEACEARYRAVSADDDAGAVVAAAIVEASRDRRPVVVGIPADLIESSVEAAGAVTAQTVSSPVPTLPDGAEAAAASQLLDELRRAERPILLAGRGVMVSGSAALMSEVAELTGAALATTLPAKGLFDGHPLDLGIAGGLSHPDAEPVFRDADLVVALGSGAGASTTRSGRLFPDARLVRLDIMPGDEGATDDGPLLRGEARATLTAVAEALRSGPPTEPWFRPARPLPDCWNAELADYQPELAPGTVDPRYAVLALDRLLPDDAVIVVSNGHCSGFASALLSAAAPRSFHLAQGFGSIGQGLTTAVGVALGAPDRHVVLVEGDAGFMMHAQDLDTAVRAGAHLTAFVLNDEALGTEYHRLGPGPGRGDLAVVPTPRIAEVAAAMGALGHQVTELAELPDAALDALAARTAVVEIRTSRTVQSRHLRWRRIPVPAGTGRRSPVTEGGTRAR
ncbi:Acetolactate synthase large subunit [Actinacidiphila yanglinensis]|uniref:Acetolactate synthase large subunit n=1 Tax=Actinacidiphila yanglinensis TaxID=310779 RepID=A0A1H6CI90_9ACTN|nr:thiamine pyrophosphate-binding protein [Actinacidiphila yanglinensis]SEG72473.1 Acetolactate synthase large subunit [Actinacidiphila yanglinensis]